MLQRTFVHIPGLGFRSEEKLWGLGIDSWSGLLDGADELFKGRKRSQVKSVIDKSYNALDLGQTDYFYANLPRSALWRLIPDFVDQIAYIDIETTGLSLPPRNGTTSIAVVYNGKLYQEYERRKKRELVKWIDSESKLICTYFGEVFDIPFLRHEYGVKFSQAHIDLCFWLRRLGFTGGLKGVEKSFKSVPRRHSSGLDGFAAVILWDRFLKGSRPALKTLMTYNAEDAVALNHLLQEALLIELKKVKQFTHQYRMPKVPKVKNQVDRKIVRELRNLFDHT
jgi:uncharacterized protein